MKKRTALRVLTLIAAVAAGAALFEGVWSLATGRSLLSVLLRASPTYRLEMLDEERLAAAAKTEGAYALAVDPQVGFRLKGGVTRSFVGVPATTDSEGQRVRPGPPPAPGAARLVVLGDSVAFGFGVADDETVGHRLEGWLAGTMAAGTARPAVSTIACPGWNLRNAIRYLTDRLDEIAPIAVVLYPAGNDLFDSFAVNEVGHRHADFDPRFGATRIHTSLEYHLVLEELYGTRRSRADSLALAPEGGPPWALINAAVSGLTPESERRWSELLREIQAFDERLARRQARLFVAIDSRDPFVELLDARLAGDLPAIPRIALFKERRSGDALPTDPHPSPAYHRAAAWCLADALLAARAVPEAGATPLPPLDPAFAARRHAPRDPAAGRAFLAEARRRRARFLGGVIDPDAGRGLHQVYGGLQLDLMVGRGLWVTLKNGGADAVRLTLERLPAASALYPLELACRFNEGPPVRVPMPAPAEGDALDTTLSVPVPPAVAAAPYFDLEILPSNWIFNRVQGVTRLAAFRLRRIEL